MELTDELWQQPQSHTTKTRDGTDDGEMNDGARRMQSPGCALFVRERYDAHNGDGAAEDEHFARAIVKRARPSDATRPDWSSGASFRDDVQVRDQSKLT